MSSKVKPLPPSPCPV